MFIIVLTGGLGAGKSTAAKYFASQGATIIDADEVASSVLSAGSEALAEVARIYGDHVVDAEGTLDRAALAEAAFSGAAGPGALNAVVHPVVEERLVTLLEGLRSSDTPPEVVVVEVPLLVEAPSIACLADEIVSIEAPAEQRLERGIARGMEPEDAGARILRQSSDDERAELADRVIVNDGSEHDFLGKLEGYWEERFGESGRRG